MKIPSQYIDPPYIDHLLSKLLFLLLTHFRRKKKRNRNNKRTTRLNNMPLGFVTIIFILFFTLFLKHNIFIKISVYISAFNVIFN